MFEARLVEEEHQNKSYVYLKVGDEDFYIDLEKNEILAGLFSEKEMASIIEDLIVENLRLETNLRMAAKSLSKTEAKVLEFSVRGLSSADVGAKMDLPADEVESCKQAICEKLKSGNFSSLVSVLREKKLQ